MNISEKRNMKNICTIIFLLLICTNITKAQDIFEIFYEGTKSQPIITDIQSKTSYEYHRSSSQEGILSDTSIVLDGDTLALFLETRIVETYPVIGTRKREHFKVSGELSLTETIVQDKAGRMLENTIESTDPQMAQFLNTTKKYTYENDKLVKIDEKDLTLVSLEYDDQSLPKNMRFNTGFANMALDRENTETGYIYNASLVPMDDQEGLMGMMADAMRDAPKTYVLYEFKDKHHYFTSIEEERETGNILGEETFIRNEKKQLVESISSKGMKSHTKYRYNDKGEVVETENVLDNTILKNESDDRGNIIKKYEGYQYYEYKYDDKNNLIEDRQFLGTNEDKSLSKLTVVKLVYK